jgi:Domain of unknown function (DUF1918)
MSATPRARGTRRGSPDPFPPFRGTSPRSDGMNAVVATMGKVIAMPARRSKAAARTKSATRKKTAARKKTVAVRRPAGRKKTAARKAAVRKKAAARRKPATKKATGRKKTAARRKPAAKKATTRKKAATRKATAKKATPRVSSRVASQPEMTPARRAATPSGRTAMPVSRASRPTMPAEPGDFILIDSPQVGSPPREGEVLEVIQGKVSVSYRVQWSDGHQTLIAPKGGTARIVRASERA